MSTYIIAYTGTVYWDFTVSYKIYLESRLQAGTTTFAS